MPTPLHHALDAREAHADTYHATYNPRYPLLPGRPPFLPMLSPLSNHMVTASAPNPTGFFALPMAILTGFPRSHTTTRKRAFSRSGSVTLKLIFSRAMSRRLTGQECLSPVNCLNSSARRILYERSHPTTPMKTTRVDNTEEPFSWHLGTWPPVSQVLGLTIEDWDDTRG